MGSRSSRSWTTLLATAGALTLATPIAAQVSQAANETTSPAASSSQSDTPENAIAIQKLDADLIERFLLVLKSVQALPASTDGSDETASSTSSSEDLAPARPTPFTTMVASSPAWSAIDPIAQRNGFVDAEAWARVGDRLALLIGIVDAMEEGNVAVSEIEATKKASAQIRDALGNDAPAAVEEGAQ